MSPDLPPTLWQTLHTAASRPDIDAAIRDLYVRLDAQIQSRGPTCWSSGKCCNFDAYGHRLYVTALETAWLLHQLTSASPTPSPSSGGQREGRGEGNAIKLVQLSARATTLPPPPKFEIRNSKFEISPTAPCPFQLDNLCSVHPIRPLGCRIFFCQQGTQLWQQELYELFLSDLRALHERFDLPYRYLEWRTALQSRLTALSEPSPF